MQNLILIVTLFCGCIYLVSCSPEWKTTSKPYYGKAFTHLYTSKDTIHLMDNKTFEEVQIILN